MSVSQSDNVSDSNSKGLGFGQILHSKPNYKSLIPLNINKD